MKYFCENCNYSTSNSKDYKKHLLTAKHKIQQNTTFYNNTKNDYICGCGKKYTHRASLYNHAKKCGDKSPTKIPKGIYGVKSIYTDVINNDNALNGEDIFSLLKQNQEFKELLIEQNKMMIEQQNENQKLQTQLIEVVKDTGNTYNSTTNNNQKFNLNFFLNTTCKDAMNMSEFIENIEVNFKDIENIGKNGYVSGMTDMILSRIKELDVTKRPMHCTDLKRETMYIKDNDEWAKDTPENSKFHKMIDYVAKQNYAKMPLWRQRNPECLDSDHPKYDFCIKMMRNMLGDVGAEQVRLDNKVIKNLSKHILVDKAVN
jgi:hypothetical protein